MMINNGAICAATALLLLQLTPLCCNIQKPPSQCKGEICYIYPDTFGQLPKVISSNRHIILNGVEFNVNGGNGFTVIENVSNLTISSAEEEGSIIKCSSESTFGLYLKNNSDISLNGITIKNCAFYIPNHTMQYESISQCNVATLVINTSKHISLLKVYIEYSPGIALDMFEPSTAINNVNYNLTLTHCTISHSRQGSLVIFGTTFVLIERTLISNSSIGIDTYKTDIKIKNVNISNCTYSSIARGCIMVIERLKMANSSIVISESNITFIGDKSISWLIVTQSNIYVGKHSVLQFQKFNDTSLYLFYSTLTLNNNSTMIFTQNNASTMVICFQSYISVSNGSTVSFTNNILIDGILILWKNCSIKVNGGILLFEKNECKSSQTILAWNTILIWENRSIFTVTHNTIKNSVMFTHNGGWMNFSESSAVFSNNSLRDWSTGLMYYESSLILCAAKLLFEDNKCQNESFLMVANDVNIKMENLSLLTFTHNKMYNNITSILWIMEAHFIVHESSVVITNNSMTDSTTTLVVLMSSFILNESFVNFVDNAIDSIYRILFYFHESVWTMSSDSELQMFNNTGYGLFTYTNASFSGAVRLVNNTVILDEGIFNAIYSELWFKGTLEVVGNRGEASAGFSLVDSDMYITGRALFLDNHAANGGAISLISSVMHISPNATVNFTNNYAKRLGGAIYIAEPRTSAVSAEFIIVFSCSIQVLPDSSSKSCQIFSLSFNQNKAGTAGNAIYGGRTSACSQCRRNTEYKCDDCSIHEGSDLFHYNGVNDSSDQSNFTSDPTRVCFCENGIPNCYKVLINVTAYPGENFNLSLAIIGYGLGTVPGLVIASGKSSREGSPEQSLFGSESEYSQEIRGITCQDVRYSIVSERDREYFALAVDEQSFLKSLEVAQSVVNFKIMKKEGALQMFSFIYDDFFHIPVFVEVDLLACPVGFQLVRGRCICHHIFLENKIDTCFFSNGTGLILRSVPYWIGLPNDTNSPILIHPHCSFDYCQSKDINITAESPNTQCHYQRSGVLCGSCRDGLSMILGSSECRNCSNVYLVSISIFIVCGVALVIILTLLNMTVSVGTLNGLILLANVLQANHTVFLRPITTSHTRALITFLDVFIAWLNLDLGIPMCFFDGLTTYVKTWLQFVFPLYILTLVGVMIIASNYSTQVTRLFGTNAVSVLATLVLLSYTKILRILITAFSFTTLSGSQDYHSVVWLADGNIKYFEPKHAILFLVALLVFMLLGVPYTVTLIAAPWIQRSRFKWVSSLYNRFKPLFDAYMGPYKDSHRYWTGMLLLARVILIVLFSSIANTNTVAGPQLNLLLLSLTSFGLTSLTATFKPYRNKLLNALDIFHLTILFIFSSSNLYASNIGTGIGPHAYIYIVLVGICFLVFLGIFVGHVWYRVQKARTGRRPQPPKREEEEHYPMVWQRARVRAEDEDEDEEREEVTMSTAGATNTVSYEGRRESLVEMIAHLPE